MRETGSLARNNRILDIERKITDCRGTIRNLYHRKDLVVLTYESNNFPVIKIPAGMREAKRYDVAEVNIYFSGNNKLWEVLTYEQ